MKIKSNTLGKLQKIKNGSVFSDTNTYIKELIQNVQRSKASKCDIRIEEKCIIFTDNGVGCKKPENLFTLDSSEWESTNEGFGIGFWSCLAMDSLEKIVVRSCDWIATLDVIKLFATGDLQVEYKKSEDYLQGFEVSLFASYLDELEITDYIQKTAKYINEIYITVNGYPIELEDMFFVNAPFFMNFENRFFKARLGINEKYCSEIKLFYEHREIEDEVFRYQLSYVSGVVEQKPNKLQLKEPDRQTVICNDNYADFVQKLNECVVTLYKEYISFYGCKDEKYEDAIYHNLGVKDYEKYLNFDFYDEDEVVNVEDTEVDMLECASVALQSIDRNQFKKPDRVLVNPNKSSNSQHANTNDFDDEEVQVYNCFKGKTQKLKKCFWVSSDEVEKYEKYIAKARYCKLQVIIATGKLQKEVLNSKEVLHISTLKENLIETFKYLNVDIKSSKEENLMLLLEPIRQKYNLPDNFFLICDLVKTNELINKGVVVYKEKISNTKEEIHIYGCCDGYNVYLDRKSLKLYKWMFVKSKVGINEMKLLMNCVNTIAHELAHYLYHTTDNTIEHYKLELSIQTEIINLYI